MNGSTAASASEGRGHKRSDRLLRMGRWLATTAGLAVIAVDGPYHGDRVPSPMGARAYQQLIVDEGLERVTARMTEDWLDTLRTLAALGLADEANVSVYAMSMGVRFGLPVAADLGSRLRCAVLGKFGIRQAEPLHPGLCAPGLITRAARAITAPVHYHVQWMTRSSLVTGSSRSSTSWLRPTSACSPGRGSTPRLIPTTRRPGRSSSGGMHDDGQPALWHLPSATAAAVEPQRPALYAAHREQSSRRPGIPG